MKCLPSTMWTRSFLIAGTLGQRFVREQARPEVLGAELDRLGDDDDLRVHGNDPLEAGRLVFFDARLFGRVDPAGGDNHAALGRVAARDPQLVRVLREREDPGTRRRLAGHGDEGIITLAHLRRELQGTLLLAEDVAHEQDAVDPRLRVVLQLRLDHRYPDLRQRLYRLGREEGTGDDDVRRLCDDRLRIARYFGDALNQRCDVGVGRVLRNAPDAYEPVSGHQRQGYLVVPDGRGDDALRLRRDAHNPVQPLDFARPSEVGRVHDSADCLERLQHRLRRRRGVRRRGGRCGLRGRTCNGGRRGRRWGARRACRERHGEEGEQRQGEGAKLSS